MGSATGTTRWRAVHDSLARRPLGELDAAELRQLADALFWLDRVDESIDVRGRAYRAFVEAEDDPSAAMAAWRLFYDHFLVGEVAPANGWIERCRRHVGDDDSVPAGWLHVARSDIAAVDDDPAERLRHACAAVAIGRARADADLTAMALQAEGRARLAAGDADGVTLLDEAMVAVTNGELDALYTGWVYCNVVSTCYDLADLDRAGQWSRLALKWCDDVAEGRMYPGLCRVYAAELGCLRGTWDRAELLVDQACTHLTAFDPRYAGEAFYLAGELRRLRGDLDAALAAYEQAHGLGRTPQPGHALCLAARDRTTEAVAALRTALPGTSPAQPLPRARVLAELVRLEAGLGDLESAGAHVAELDDLARSRRAPVIVALADGARGRVLAAEGDHVAALRLLHRGADLLTQLDVPHESARLRLDASHAAAAAGDRATARLDADAAGATFERLGARLDAADAAAWAGELQRASAPSAGDHRLSGREREVLAHLAAGRTNREIAERLFVSPHTVGRHVSNIFAKLGVSSRAAATAYAYEHDLLDP